MARRTEILLKTLSRQFRQSFPSSLYIYIFFFAFFFVIFFSFSFAAPYYMSRAPRQEHPIKGRPKDSGASFPSEQTEKLEK